MPNPRPFKYAHLKALQLMKEASDLPLAQICQQTGCNKDDLLQLAQAGLIVIQITSHTEIETSHAELTPAGEALLD